MDSLDMSPASPVFHTEESVRLPKRYANMTHWSTTWVPTQNKQVSSQVFWSSLVFYLGPSTVLKERSYYLKSESLKDKTQQDYKSK